MEGELELAVLAGDAYLAERVLERPHPPIAAKTFILALEQGDLDMARMMLRDPDFPDYGEDTDVCAAVVESNALDIIDLFAYHPNTAADGLFAMFEEAIDANADLEIVSHLHDAVVLPVSHYAYDLLATIDHRNMGMFEFFANKIDKAEISKCNPNDLLLRAIGKGFPELVARVLAFGADPSHDRNHALDLALDDHTDDECTIIKMLLADPRVDPEARNSIKRAIDNEDVIALALLRDEIDARAGYVRRTTLTAIPAALTPIPRMTIYLFLHTTRVPALQPRFSAAVHSALESL